MKCKIQCDWKFDSELRRQSDLSGVPLSSVDVTPDLSDLLEETYVSGVMADVVPESLDDVCFRVDPLFSQEPLVESIRVHLEGNHDGAVVHHTAEFKSGPWQRKSQQRVLDLRQEGTLGENDTAYRTLVALPNGESDSIEPPVLQPPPIVDGSLEQFGVRKLGKGEFVPDRPIVINERMEADSVTACVSAGANETGGAALGVFLRLEAPLPNTSTRIVTLLTACLEDQRHSGRLNAWSISPEALAESAQIAAMRGMNESVLTILHTHGWSSECGKCNDNANCPLAECTHVSLMDYQVLETLFPGKATIMPIAGRKLGAEGRRPVLAVHAWRGGEMRPMRWMRYSD